MICCKERDKKHWFRKLCMQWTELAAIDYIPHPNNIFFPFFSLISITHMERINKATLFGNLLF